MRVSLFASIAGLAILSVAAQAQVNFFDGPGGNIDTNYNILFNEDGLINEGFMIQGITNTDNIIVNFWSDTSLTATVSGATGFGATGGGTFDNVEITLDDPSLWFTNVMFSVNAEEAGTITLSVETDQGTFTQDFALTGNGREWFRIVADHDVQITSASFVADVGIEDVRHVRAGIVPEPATLLGLGLGAAALLRRKRKQASK
jgi:predicted dehydrogenase